ncbi:MAG: LamG-like jellyroll fold domain-containing protein [Thermoguttaceae bacterium]|nr:LamG-like jellyroll fold domain-containing protein [Thermoguttaceae bacterium]
MIKEFVALVVCFVTFGQFIHGGEVLLYERFETLPEGKCEGGVNLVEDVVGFGGLELPNRTSLRLDGQPGSCINYGATKALESVDFTVEAFVKLASDPDYDVVASCWNEDGENRAWALVILPGGAVRFDISPDGKFYPQNKLTTRPGAIRPGNWYHIAAVSCGNTSYIFVNGRLLASLERPVPGIFAQPKANLKLGGADRYAGKVRSLRGQLDEVRITLSALEPKDFVKTRQPMPEVVLPGPPKQYLMPFTAKTPEEAFEWQHQARAKLLELVAQQVPRMSLEQVPLDLRRGSAQDKGSYTIEQISFRANAREDRRWNGLLAIPRGQRPFPAILALHGHGGSAEAVFDVNPSNIYRGFADRFARGGYVVLAPSFSHQPYAANLLWDLMRCVDILTSLPEVDSSRIGVAGLSMGGEWSMYIAACDERIKAAVVSGWMCTTEGVFSVPNCECWQLPGLVELMDICEVHLLIAPRPVVFESAEYDGCFPIRYSREGFERIKAGYRVFGAEDALVQDTWPGGHEWHGIVAYPFMDKVLGGHAAKVP